VTNKITPELRAELEWARVKFPNAMNYLSRKIEQLEERDRTLSALESAGVDNWEGYSEAFRDLEDEEERQPHCYVCDNPGRVCLEFGCTPAEDL
jgi:hypothetical protein